MASPLELWLRMDTLFTDADLHRELLVCLRDETAELLLGLLLVDPALNAGEVPELAESPARIAADFLEIMEQEIRAGVAMLREEKRAREFFEILKVRILSVDGLSASFTPSEAKHLLRSYLDGVAPELCTLDIITGSYLFLKVFEELYGFSMAITLAQLEIR